ncbi:cobalt-precorrin 5A hydrolase [Bacillus massiliigorillae]|uniref:cobalt-precorrin 5A hydrolase n=1 Tax=Bacillus massiliigorillae TaxID=1243664 RepID=UPI0003A18DAB|nr:cobalt-precorrin 5A hydrolase [Bacillus massiliigorillae]
MNTVKRIAVVALTENGVLLAKEVNQHMHCDIYVGDKIAQQGTENLKPTFQEGMKQLFQTYDALVCIMATGIVVRTLAPYITDKLSDPAVVVMDEKAKHVISLLSGHIGGANELTSKLAKLLHSDPVITTATDVQEVAALDNIAQKIDARIPNFRENVKLVNGLLASNKRVGLYNDTEYDVDSRGFIIIDELDEVPKDIEALVYIGDRLSLQEFNIPKIIKVVPKTRILGIGCKKNTDFNKMRIAFSMFCEKWDIDPHAFHTIVSIDVKQDEPAIKKLAEIMDCEFHTYTASQLETVSYHYPVSDFVQKTVGVGNVALSSVHLACDGNVLTDRYIWEGMTMAMGYAKYNQ